jgi:hypothetical protein
MDGALKIIVGAAGATILTAGGGATATASLKSLTRKLKTSKESIRRMGRLLTSAHANLSIREIGYRQRQPQIASTAPEPRTFAVPPL